MDTGVSRGTSSAIVTCMSRCLRASIPAAVCCVTVLQGLALPAEVGQAVAFARENLTVANAQRVGLQLGLKVRAGVEAKPAVSARMSACICMPSVYMQVFGSVLVM